MGGADPPQADHEEENFFLERDFVFPFSPADYSLAAHLHVSGKRPLPGSPVDGAREPDELLGRNSFVARGAPQGGVLTDGSTLSREPRVRGAPPRIARDARHELALAIAGHGRPLPRQDGHQRQPVFIRRHVACPSRWPCPPARPRSKPQPSSTASAQSRPWQI